MEPRTKLPNEWTTHFWAKAVHSCGSQSAIVWFIYHWQQMYSLIYSLIKIIIFSVHFGNCSLSSWSLVHAAYYFTFGKRQKFCLVSIYLILQFVKSVKAWDLLLELFVCISQLFWLSINLFYFSSISLITYKVYIKKYWKILQ